MKKLILFTSLFLFNFSNSFAGDSYFIDFSKVLNKSKAGAQAQKNLKTKFESESKKFNKKESDLKKEEIEIIAQKKTITSEEYKKKVDLLRSKVADLQKE